MALSFDLEGNEISGTLSDSDKKLKTVVSMFASTEALRLRGVMQSKRPWTDRTGMAKATLNTSVSQPSNDITRITLSHGVDYGIWLELANEKRYAIIGPTLNLEGPTVLGKFNGMMDKLMGK